MRLRVALKIVRWLHGLHKRPWKRPHWRPATIDAAYAISDRKYRKWRDRRFPHIDSDDEKRNSFGLGMSILADAFIADEQKRDEFKDQLWTQLEAER